MRLRSYLLALALVTVLPLLIFSIWMTVSAFYEHLGAVKEGLLNTSRSVSLAVDHEMLASIKELEALGTSDLNDADASRFHEQAVRVAAHGAWPLLTVFAPSGRRIVHLGRLPDDSGLSNSEADAFRKAVAAAELP